MTKQVGMTKRWKFVAAVLVLVLVLMGLGSLGLVLGVPFYTVVEEAVPRSDGYQCDVYVEQGCGKMVVGSGGELEVRDGATLDIQSGSTVGFEDVTVNGDLDVVGATTMEALGTGVAGTGADVQFFSDTSGDHLLWDASDVALEITGTSAQDALAIAEGNATVTLGDLTVSAGDFEVTAGATTLGALFYPSFADETITDGETLTPTVTVYNLDSGGAVTMTIAACTTDGQPLVLVGDDANNITINDTNVRTNDGGVQVIGQYDVITWICIDLEWLEISESNNS